MAYPQPIDAATLQQGLQRGELLLLDVRDPAEFAASHIPQACSVPLGQLTALWPTLQQTKQQVVFQCQRGNRSQTACTVLGEAAQGAYTLEGGIEAWVAAGLPVVGIAGPKVPLMRQVQLIVGGAVAMLVTLGFATGQPWAFAVAGGMGVALFTAGLTGWCGLALLLQRLPWNR